MNSMPLSQPGGATIDGNQAIARVAYALNEVISITAATPIGERAQHVAARETHVTEPHP